jgi:hypothetical protein
MGNEQQRGNGELEAAVEDDGRDYDQHSQEGGPAQRHEPLSAGDGGAHPLVPSPDRGEVSAVSR